jgi:hypothetical protein
VSSKWSPVSAIYLHGRESDCNLKWSRNVHRRQDFPTTWHAFFELCVHSLWQGDCVQLRCPSEVALPWKNQRFVACFATRKGLPWRCSTNDNVEFIAPWKHRPKESQKRSQAQRYWGNGKLKKLLQRLSAIKRLRFTRLPSLPIPYVLKRNCRGQARTGRDGIETFRVLILRWTLPRPLTSFLPYLNEYGWRGGMVVWLQWGCWVIISGRSPFAFKQCH